MALALGILLSVTIWVGVMQIIAWTWNQHVSKLAASGQRVDARDRHMSISRVAHYHTVGWTFAIFLFFVLLDLADFPLWQMLGFAGLLALVYGTGAITRGEGEWVGKDDPQGKALFGRRRDALWYRVLMVADWAAYLACIVFGAALTMEALA